MRNQFDRVRKSWIHAYKNVRGMAGDCQSQILGRACGEGLGYRGGYINIEGEGGKNFCQGWMREGSRSQSGKGQKDIEK